MFGWELGCVQGLRKAQENRNVREAQRNHNLVTVLCDVTLMGNSWHVRTMTYVEVSDAANRALVTMATRLLQLKA